MPGDTLASALLANDVKLVGRSFKYHRPRGIVGSGTEEPNALVELRNGARREPNTRATTTELYDGLDALSQNRWPSLDFDVLAVNSLFSPFFGAAFTTRPSCGRKPPGKSSTSRRSATPRAWAARRSFPTPIITRRCRPFATCW